MGNHLKRGQSEPIEACQSGAWYLLMDCVYLHSPSYLHGDLFFFLLWLLVKTFYYTYLGV